MISPIIKNGYFAAGIDTNFNHYERLVTDEFRKSDKYLTNKFINKRPPALLSYGIEMVKKSLPKKGDVLHKSAKRKLCGIYDTYHIDKYPFLIDSGGFSITIGRVDKNYIDHLRRWYIQFIREMCENDKYKDMLFQFLDIVPTGDITQQFALDKMLEFHNDLKSGLSGIDCALERMYVIFQYSTMEAYEIFRKLIFEHRIQDEYNCHKYSQGSLVPLNFNQSIYPVRPWMLGLFDTIRLEYDNLKKGSNGQNSDTVYFHILGTSALVEVILATWINILCEEYGMDLVITYDSTSAINNAVRAGVMHYVDETLDPMDTQRITQFLSKYRTIDQCVPGRSFKNRYYINRMWDDLKSVLDVTDEDDPIFDDAHRWTSMANCIFGVYELYSYTSMINYVRDVCMLPKNREIVLDREHRFYGLKNLLVQIISRVNPAFIMSSGKTRFNTNVVANTINSLELADLALQGKFGQVPETRDLIDKMFYNNGELFNLTDKQLPEAWE